MIKGLIGLALTPLLAYPLLFVGLAAVEAWRGERLIQFHLRHEQRVLWDTFWIDYAASLPVMYLIAIMLVTTYVILARVWPVSVSVKALVSLVALAAVAGWAFGVYLSGSWIGLAHVAFAASSTTVGVTLAHFVRRVPRRLGAE